MSNPHVESFWDQPTGSWQYVVHDPATKRGAVIDPVWDFDPLAGATSLENAERILAHISTAGLSIDWVLDTHPHADHFSAAPFLAERLGARTAIGERVRGVQELWKGYYHLEGFPTDGSQWSTLFKDGERFMIGSMEARCLFSPGHTLASMSYIVGDAGFVHDTLMMPDSGTSRADFPGGCSAELYASLARILALPGDTRLYIGHDYAPNGRDALCMATVAEQLAANIHVGGQPGGAMVDEASFRQRRDARDATLPLPKLMLLALQVNIRGGRLPAPEADGRSYLKLPVDLFESRRRRI